jgi:large subunit ribosomal protein L3
MVEAAATHELPPLPGAEEVAAGVAESDAQADDTGAADESKES